MISEISADQIPAGERNLHIKGEPAREIMGEFDNPAHRPVRMGYTAPSGLREPAYPSLDEFFGWEYSEPGRLNFRPGYTAKTLNRNSMKPARITHTYYCTLGEADRLRVRPELVVPTSAAIAKRYGITDRAARDIRREVMRLVHSSIGATEAA